MISSPVISVLIEVASNERNNNLAFLQHLWVGIAVSFPLSVVVARFFGDTNSMIYGQYLESLGGHSKRVIIYSWGFAAAVAFLGAIAIAFTT
jgi:hypothetical protein